MHTSTLISCHEQCYSSKLEEATLSTTLSTVATVPILKSNQTMLQKLRLTVNACICNLRSHGSSRGMQQLSYKHQPPAPICQCQVPVMIHMSCVCVRVCARQLVA